MSFIQFFRNRWAPSRNNLPFTTCELSGRTVVITGANTGLGLDTAKEMYKMTPKKLILAVRNASQGERAKEEILASHKDGLNAPSGEGDVSAVEVWEIDMANFGSVKAFISRCEKELDRLDILLLNAGVSRWLGYDSTSDGWERTLQVNVLSTFLLAICLAPLVVNTARLPAPSNVHLKPHLVVVSSEIHASATFKEQNASKIFNALNDEKQYEFGDRYMVTKVLEILLVRQMVMTLLPKLLDTPLNGMTDSGEANVKPEIVVCTVNPGWCRTTLLRDYPSLTRRIMNAIMAREPIEGVKCYLWACFNNDIPLGGYSSFCAVERESAFVYSDAGKKTQQRVWDELVTILGDVEPRVKSLVGTE